MWWDSFSFNNLYLTQFLTGKLTSYSRVLRSAACVALVQKAAYEIRNNFFRSFRMKKLNELAGISNKLTNNSRCLVTSGIGQRVAYGLPVGPCWFIYTPY
jgi:hypothetical protein